MTGKRWLLLLCGIGLYAGVALADPVWQPVAERVITHLEAAEAAYHASQPDKARREISQGYFGVFETEKMEAAMRTRLGAKHTYGVERQFGELRKAIQQGAEESVIAEQVAKLSADLRRDAGALDKAGVPAGVFEVNH